MSVVRARPESNYGRMSKFLCRRSYLALRLAFAFFRLPFSSASRSFSSSPPRVLLRCDIPKLPLLSLFLSLLLSLSLSSLHRLSCIVFFSAESGLGGRREYRDWVVHPVAALRRQHRSSLETPFVLVCVILGTALVLGSILLDGTLSVSRINVTRTSRSRKGIVSGGSCVSR